MSYYFDLKTSKIYKARKTVRRFPAVIFSIIAVLTIVMLTIVIIDVKIPKISILTGIFPAELIQRFIFLLVLTAFSSIIFSFYLNYLKRNLFANKNQYNIAEYLTFNAAEIYLAAVNDRRNLNFLDKIVISTLESKVSQFVFDKFAVSPDEITAAFFKTKDYFTPASILRGEQLIQTDNEREYTNNFFLKVLKNTVSTERNFIDAGDILYTVSLLDSSFRNILFTYEIRPEDLLEGIEWYRRKEKIIEKQKQFWNFDNLVKSEGIGKDWGNAYTVNLDNYSQKLMSAFHMQGIATKIIDRTKEMNEIAVILDRAQENNCLIIGPPGIGKKTIIYGLAEKIREGSSLSSLAYSRVLLLDLDSVVAGVESKNEIIGRLKNIFFEAEYAGNIILVIDEFHNFIGGVEKVGLGDISQILLPYLRSPFLHIIGITSLDGFHQNIEKAPGIVELFEKVTIKELPFPETLKILERTSEIFSMQYNVRITLPALRAIIEQTDLLFPNKVQPEKSLDILEEAFAETKSRKKRHLTKDDIHALLSRKTGVPTVSAKDEEREILLRLEKHLHKRVVNQETAINAIADSMRRARTQVRSSKRPIGSFLFLGPTGVGKTETAKTLAEKYFGNENRMLRFDMSEFQDQFAINRFIGSSSDQNQQGQFTNMIRENPYSLILLDEIEKANPRILDLFLQVLDEGMLTDTLGRKASFLNTIIIATSNAASGFIIEEIQNSKEGKISQEKLLQFIQKNNLFRPEFINRFDGVIAFQPLSMEHQIEVARLMLQGLQKRIMTEKEIYIMIDEKMIKTIAKLGYDPTLGARPMRRVIQEKIEGELAKMILRGEAKRGSEVRITIHS